MHLLSIRTPRTVCLAALLIAFVSAALAACAATSSMASADAPPVTTLIVKPRIATNDPAAVIKPMVAALGSSAGVKYVRPMAGDAHVVYLTAPAQRGEVPGLIERLRGSGAFQYVEVDSMMKAQ